MLIQPGSADLVPASDSTPPRRWVVCLCAEWCGTCRDYRPLMAQVARQFPAARFVWLDVEDRADLAGDIDVETFPSLLVADGGVVRFYGPMLPQAGLLARLLASLDDGAPGARVQAVEPEVDALVQSLGTAAALQGP